MSTLSLPSSDVVEKIRAGEASGMEVLYHVTANAAKGKLSRSVDPYLVQDRLHDIVVTVLEAIRNGTLRQPEKLMGFVRTVTRRRVAAHIRNNVVGRRRLVPLDPEHPSVAVSPQDALEESERRGALRSLLAGICPRDREILVRFYLKEENPETICAEMGLTETQFRLYKSRAVARCSALVRNSTGGPAAEGPALSRPRVGKASDGRVPLVD